MEAVLRGPGTDDARPPLLLLESSLERRRGVAWLASVLLHVAAVIAIALMPRSLMETARRVEFHPVIPLVAPPLELTQTAPNRGPVGHEFALENLLPRPRVRIPAAIPPIGRPAPVLVAPPAIPRQVPEAPPLEAAPSALAQAAPLGSPTGMPAAPPQIQAEEKPQLAFETLGRPSGAPRAPAPGQPRIPPPGGGSVTEAARAAIRQGGGGLVVGDLDVAPSPGIGGGLTLPGSRPQNRSALELMSDPQGVDFKPYLIQVLQAVKRNWLAVIPESARLGTRSGRVQIQFAIARNGEIAKIVIATPSGTQALDLAAVAGINSSIPFPPFPTGYRADQLRLQFTFSYNQ